MRAEAGVAKISPIRTILTESGRKENRQIDLIS